MSDQIQPFDFKGTQVRAMTDESGNPWFVAKDVCDALGISNGRDAVSALDDDEKNTVAITDGIPGNPNKAIVSESGLYSLVLRSRKPEAREFKRWVTHEVLPSIRKHGAYMTTDVMEKALGDPDFAIGLLTTLKREREENRQLTERNRVLEPKARALDDFTDVSGTLSVADTAKHLSNAGAPIGRDRLFEFMHEIGWVYRSNGAWTAMQRHVDAGHLVMKSHVSHGTHHDGTRFAYAPAVRVTRKGLLLLHRKWCDHILTGQLDGQPALDCTA